MTTLTKDMRKDYERLWSTVKIKDSKKDEVELIVNKILKNKQRYAEVANNVGVPWYFIAVVHNMEGSLDFHTHLHNGDSLSYRTHNVPVGRPKTGNPPFSWEFSAEDALRYDKVDQWKDWSLSGMLFKIEGFNGFGSRNHGINTPYLWSFTQHYIKGKYVRDGVWSSSAVSSQVGACCILKMLSDMGEIHIIVDNNGDDIQEVEEVTLTGEDE